MKILSWNVNGLKSSLDNNFEQFINDTSADLICLQETKVTKEMKELKLENYHKYFNYTNKGGYSGVAIFSKEKPVNVIVGMPSEDEYGENEDLDTESRVITAEFNDFFLVSVYVPCSQRTYDRKNFRMDFDYNFNEYIEKLNMIKNVIVCGDFNLCHQKIDICNLEKHNRLEIFSDEDRDSFNELLNKGFIDTYRYMHPQMRKYTFWTNDIEDRINCKFGWRLDYILVSDYLRKEIRQANILSEIRGSDHCPIELIINI